MSQDTNKAQAFELADALLKSWWTVVAGLCFGLAGALLALDYMPRIFEASTKVRIAPQEIPEDWVKSTVTDDMSQRLREIRQAILTRGNMLELAKRNLEIPKDDAELDGMIRWLRSSVDVQSPRESRLFILTFHDTDAERSANIVNTLTELYIEQNRDFRSSMATKMREQYETSAGEAKVELDAAEKALNEYISRHLHETEAALGVNMQKLETRRLDLGKNRTDQRFARQRLEDLRLQRGLGASSADPDVIPDGEFVSTASVRLAQLERELQELLVDHTDSHPDVVTKRREINELKKLPATTDPSRPNALPADPKLAALETQIRSTQTDLARLQAEEQTIQSEIQSIERKIDRTPAVQTQLTDLQARHAEIETKYRDLKDKAEQALKSESMEASDQGQRLEVIEWATVPFSPISPDPNRVYLLGVIVGIALFVGPLLLGRFLNPIISSEAGLRSLIDVPVLVSVPRVITRDNVGTGRKRFFKNLGFSVLFTALLAAVFVVLRLP